MRAPIHSNKHYVQKSLTTVLAGVVNTTVLAIAEEVVDINTVNEIEQGAVVKAFYLELWLRGQDTSPGSFVFVIEKRPGIAQALSMNATDMAALGDYENKKNILFTSMALTNVNTSEAIPLVRGWFKIPKSKQRFGLKDSLVFHVFAQALDSNICGFSTYKEYT